MKVDVIKPKSLKNKKGLPMMCYNHGGGAVMFSKNEMTKALAGYALAFGMIIFNVDYRLAPETKCPGGQMDAAAAVEYMYTNAEQFAGDKTSITLSGDSGGSWIAMGAAILLGRANKQHMVRLLFLGNPMINDTESRVDRTTVPDWEKGLINKDSDNSFSYRLLAKDFEEADK